MVNFKVQASSYLGAIRKVSREIGLQGRLRKVSDYGDMVRYDVRGAALCLFVQDWDDAMVFVNLKTI